MYHGRSLPDIIKLLTKIAGDGSNKSYAEFFVRICQHCFHLNKSFDKLFAPDGVHASPGSTVYEKIRVSPERELLFIPN